MTAADSKLKDMICVQILNREHKYHVRIVTKRFKQLHFISFF